MVCSDSYLEEDYRKFLQRKHGFKMLTETKKELQWSATGH
jgi:hypothetical protein